MLPEPHICEGLDEDYENCFAGFVYGWCEPDCSGGCEPLEKCKCPCHDKE